MANFDLDQIRAITSLAESTIVLAGAGSGKTTTMLGRVGRALSVPTIMNQLKRVPKEDLDPRKIVIASFTNNAANTFVQRLERLLNDRKKAEAIHVSTLDKLAGSIIRQHYPLAHYDESAWETAQLIYNKLQPTALTEKYDSAYTYHTAIRDPKGRSGWQLREAEFDHYLPDVARYQLHELKAMTPEKRQDYPLILALKTIYLVAIGVMIETRSVPDIDLMIIDEMQDSSDKQFMFFRFLRQQLPNLKLMMVGDISQSMYRWRDAKPERVREYIRDFPTRVLTLPNNYRSQPEIIRYANRFLDFNLDNRPEHLQLVAATTRDAEIPARLLPPVTYAQSISTVIQRIRTLLAIHVAPRDIALLVRSHNQLQKITEKLEDEAPELHFANSESDQLQGRMYSIQRALGILQPLVTRLHSQPIAATLNALPAAFMATRSRAHNGDMSLAERLYIQQPIVDNTASIREQCQQTHDHLQKVCYALQSQLSNTRSQIGQIAGLSSPHGEMTLTTVHKAKGLEYKYVFYFPSFNKTSKLHYVDYDAENPSHDPAWGDLAELQNIHYVAVTRAIDKLCVVDLASDRHTEKFPIIDAQGHATGEYVNRLPEYRLLTNQDDPEFNDESAMDYVPEAIEANNTAPSPVKV